MRQARPPKQKTQSRAAESSTSTCYIAVSTVPRRGRARGACSHSHRLRVAQVWEATGVLHALDGGDLAEAAAAEKRLDKQACVVSDLPCYVRREGGESLVIGGSSLVILEGKACNPL